MPECCFDDFNVASTMIECTLTKSDNQCNKNTPYIFAHSPPPTRKISKVGMSKDTSDIIKKDESILPLKSCILLQKDEYSEVRIPVKKAKSVHFADSLGKPLKSVKTLFDNSDEDFGLSFLSLRSTTRKTFSVDIFKRNCDGFGDVSSPHNKLLNFKQPVTTKDFQMRVENNNVCLENVVFREYGVFATVAVKNISYVKQVSVKYTLNNWETHETINATYVPGSSTGWTDTFSFEIIPKGSISDISYIELAVCYSANNQEHWDSNYGKNYSISFQGRVDYKKNSVDNYNGFILSKQNFIGWAT